MAAPERVRLAEVSQAGQEAIPYWQQLHQQAVVGAKVILLLPLGLVGLAVEVQAGRRHHLRVLERQLKDMLALMEHKLLITRVEVEAVQGQLDLVQQL